MPLLEPNPPKLYLNEHLSPRLAAALRKRGRDVIASLEVGMEHKDDDEHLARATAEERAVVSFNSRDFEPLHQDYVSAGKEHWGIILSTQVPFAVLFRRLLRLLHALSAEELKNQLRWLNDFK